MSADEETESRIARAAALQRVSVSTFVLGAAGREADRVLSEVEQSVMPAAQSDATLRAQQARVCAPTRVRREALPSRRMAGGYSEVPGYLLGRLALDQTLHGKRLGSQLLLDALERIVDAARHALRR